MAGPVRTEPGGHKVHATSRIRDQSKEVGDAVHQPEHGIWPGSRAVHRLPVIAPRNTGEMVANVERARSAGINKKHQVLVTKIQRGHRVSPRIVPHAPLLIRAIPAGGLQQLGVQTKVQVTDQGA